MSLLFLSVVRQGLSRSLPLVDTGAADATLAGRDLGGALELTASATVNTLKGADVLLRVIGPGDAVGLDPSMVLRTDPPPGAQSVDRSLFTQVELDLPGLPWMFTPLAASGDRLRPWIALVAMPFDSDGTSPLDLEPLRRGRLPVLTVPGLDELPPIEETWAWAHAQLTTAEATTAVPADLDTQLETHPEASLSRLVCPRRLAIDTHYVACIVPTFEATRTAALGRAPAKTLEPAWGASAIFPLELPVFHHWTFFTGDAGTFEETVRRLRGADPPAASGRVVDASAPGPAAVKDEAAKALPLAGALKPEALTVRQYKGPAVTGYTQFARTGQVVTARGGGKYPVVDLPLYGGRHAGVSSVPGAPVWVRELNTDPRHRATAALGARIVRENQEALMRSAWEQAGDVEEANRRLRRARLGREASQRIVNRHVKPLDDVARLRLLAPAFGRIGLPQSDRTLAGVLSGSRLPDLVLGPMFTSLTRPGGRLGRHLAPPKTVTEVVTGIDGGTLEPDRGQLGRPGGLVTLEGVLGLLDAARESVVAGGDRTPVTIRGLRPTEPGVVRVEAAATGVGRRATEIRVTDRTALLGGPGTATRIRGDFALPSATTTRRLTPDGLTAERVRHFPGRVTFGDGALAVDVTDESREALADLFEVLDPSVTPTSAAFDVVQVAGDALAAVQPETTIPRAVLALLSLPATPAGVDPIDDVLAAPRFPTPLARELIRLAPDFVVPGLDEVPIDRVFALVTNPPFVHAVLAGANHEMMRELRWRGYPTDERGTTFHRFWREDTDELPDLHTIRMGSLGNALSGGANDVVVVVRSELLARFQGTLVYAVPATMRGTPDFAKIELPLFRGTIATDVAYFGFEFTADTATRSGGRFLVFQEPATSPSFGLDESSTVSGFPRNASELAWTNVTLTGSFVKAERPGSRPFDDNGATWGATAADLAAATYQQPVRAAIHFRELLS